MLLNTVLNTLLVCMLTYLIHYLNDFGFESLESRQQIQKEEMRRDSPV
jgi:bacterioferritin (cytochrome b1)